MVFSSPAVEWLSTETHTSPLKSLRAVMLVWTILSNVFLSQGNTKEPKKPNRNIGDGRIFFTTNAEDFKRHL